MRKRFQHSIAPGGLAGDRRGVVPASGFSFSAQEIWKIIKENKDLDLPAHKVDKQRLWCHCFCFTCMSIFLIIYDPTTCRSWLLLFDVKKLLMRNMTFLFQIRYLHFFLYSCPTLDNRKY